MYESALNLNVMTETKDDLIWRREDIKDFFNIYGLWPSFIGSSVEHDRISRIGLVPVIMWSEQKRFVKLYSIFGYSDVSYCFSYMQYKQLSQLSENRSNVSDSVGNSRKRKLPRNDDNFNNKMRKKENLSITDFLLKSTHEFISWSYSVCLHYLNIPAVVMKNNTDSFNLENAVCTSNDFNNDCEKVENKHQFSSDNSKHNTNKVLFSDAYRQKVSLVDKLLISEKRSIFLK